MNNCNLYQKYCHRHGYENYETTLRVAKGGVSLGIMAAAAFGNSEPCLAVVHDIHKTTSCLDGHDMTTRVWDGW